MAFTALQIAKVLFHLNYPATSWAKTTIENALNDITALSADLETQVSGIITELDVLQTELATYMTAAAGVQVQTDGQVNYRSQAIAEINGRYSFLVQRLVAITGLTDNRSGNAVRYG